MEDPNMRFLVFLLSLFFTGFAHAELSYTTTAFLDEGAIPVLYTCAGKDISPQMAWSDAPAKTQSFAIILDDPTAPSGDFYHWIVYNIPNTTKELAEGIQKMPAGTLIGKNSFGKQTYNGPCPPKGEHHIYIYTLYALDTKLTLPNGAGGEAVLQEVKKHTLEKKTLTASFSRWIL